MQKQFWILQKKEHLRFKEIPLKIYFILIDISSELSNLKGLEQIYLFGSYAKLIYTEKSDIDLAVVTKGNQIKIKEKVKKIEKKYNKIIELHFFDSKDMKQNDPFIKDILRNGVKLMT